MARCCVEEDLGHIRHDFADTGVDLAGNLFHLSSIDVVSKIDPSCHEQCIWPENHGQQLLDTVEDGGSA